MKKKFLLLVFAITACTTRSVANLPTEATADAVAAADTADPGDGATAVAPVEADTADEVNFAADSIDAGGVTVPDPTVEGFDAPELLGRPTATSVTLNLLPSQDVELYVEHGSSNRPATQQTAVQVAPAHQPAVVVLDGLAPSTAYGYRVRWRTKGSSGAFNQGPPRTFHTQRKAGETFRFTVQSDSHLDDNTVLAQYHRTLDNVLIDQPDFHLDLGDTFMCEKHAEAFTTVVKPAADAATVTKRYLYERDHFGRVSHSVPLFLVNGNHEGEFGYGFLGTGNDLPTWVTQARKTFYLNPTPDTFYSGDVKAYPMIGQRAAWYAWQWGDALFITLDPYWNNVKKSKDAWDLTLGKAQYDWLSQTLAESTAKWKFLFLHNLVGGLDGAMRGGVEAAPFFEWGGANADGSPGFAAKRPGWAKPIHALLTEHKVTAVFHGHDHVYVHQSLDGVVYQVVPQPSAKNTQNGAQLAAAYHYDSGTVRSSAGHLRVTVGPNGVTGEYVRAWLPSAEKGTQKNGEIAHAWSVQVN